VINNSEQLEQNLAEKQSLLVKSTEEIVQLKQKLQQTQQEQKQIVKMESRRKGIMQSRRSLIAIKFGNRCMMKTE